MAEQKLVLVTGGTGFIGTHCIKLCLEKGYSVRITVRSLKGESDLRKSLERGEAPPLENLSVVEADLLKDDGWMQAVEGCEYVLHVASPFPARSEEHTSELQSRLHL